MFHIYRGAECLCPLCQHIGAAKEAAVSDGFVVARGYTHKITDLIDVFPLPII